MASLPLCRHFRAVSLPAAGSELKARALKEAHSCALEQVEPLCGHVQQGLAP